MDQHVAVEAGEVDQRPVEGVALGSGGPGLLPPLEVLELPGRAAGRPGGALAGAGFMASFGMGPAYIAIAGLYVAGALLTL